VATHTACKAASWIQFLRQYGPIPRNDNMYDEALQRVLKRRKDIAPFKFAPEYLPAILANFQSARPQSVILTGTAGDGKTFYCRETWQALAPSTQPWDSEKKVQVLELTNINLTVIKDLSELGDAEKISQLHQMAITLIRPTSNNVYLMAANDGQLIEAWKLAVNSLKEVLVNSSPAITAEALDANTINAIRKDIEDLLLTDCRVSKNYPLQLYNLSRANAARLFPLALNAILQHPGWDNCQHCPYRQPITTATTTLARCPILENRDRLVSPLLSERLIQLLELCELNGRHISIRQLLLLLTNAILGHPLVKDKLMECKDVPQILAEETTASASIYGNIFGENLAARRRELPEIFATLGHFGIGEESSNQIDNLLVFGEADPNLRADYEQLVRADEYYGANTNYQQLQRAYLEGGTADEVKKFLNLLKTQRQRLFFVVPEEKIAEFQLWQMTLFHYADEFLHQVYRTLQRRGRINSQIVPRLVRGLNRIFIGQLVNNRDELILATAGNFSQARICRVFEDSISVKPKRGESIDLRYDPESEKVFLVVRLSHSDKIPTVELMLSLTRYEYLCRVAEGALPHSFSRECYEDMLAFKTRLLRQLFVRRRDEQEEHDAENTVRLISELDDDGIIHNPASLEVHCHL
jgi:hypothetical protein